MSKGFSHGDKVRLVRALPNRPEIPVGSPGVVRSSPDFANKPWVKFTVPMVGKDSGVYDTTAQVDLADIEHADNGPESPLPVPPSLK